MEEHDMSIYDTVKALADSLIQKGEASNPESAISAVFKMRPDLYETYRRAAPLGNVTVLSRASQKRALSVRDVGESLILEKAAAIQKARGCDPGEALCKAVEENREIFEV